MKLLICMITILNVGNAYASYLDNRSAALLYAESYKDLKAKTESLYKDQKLQVECEFELSKELIPRSCYKLRLPLPRIAVVDQACERAAHHLTEEVALRDLSQKCKAFVSQKNKNIRYSKEELSPESLILK